MIPTAIRVAVSSVFGEFADRRESMAAARDIDVTAKTCDDCYQYGKESEDFWFDFVADVGDGWNPTYAIARLLAEPELRVDGHGEPLPAGRFLVMGGDQVYPTASREDYTERLIEPYNEARLWKPWPPGTRDLYALPGNHDWYDGLSSFMGIFCARVPAHGGHGQQPGRVIGGRHTHQTRSYFAIQLPHGYWLWGADVQLSGYIDQPQLAFFKHVAENWMDKGSRLILCTGEPSWAYAPHDHAAEQEKNRFKNFTLLENIATRAQRGHRLCLVLSGDAHHYARFVEEDRQYIGAGGGGAFLHPTHHLRDKLNVSSDFPLPGSTATEGSKRNFWIAKSATGKESLYPDRETSQSLAHGTLLFPIWNWQFTLTLAGAYLFVTWLMLTNATVLNVQLVQQLSAGNFCAGVWQYLNIALASPWLLLFALTAFGGFYYFADAPDPWPREDSKGWRRVLHEITDTWPRIGVGAAHWLVQAVIVILTTIVVAFVVRTASNPNLRLLALTAVLGGLLSSFTFGAYLYVALRFWGRHWNEAFSALRIEGFKCFLRLRIGKDGKLTVFPIGVETVPREPVSGKLRNRPVCGHLIEEPIEIECLPRGVGAAPAGSAGPTDPAPAPR
jgi:hypothetical protein